MAWSAAASAPSVSRVSIAWVSSSATARYWLRLAPRIARRSAAVALAARRVWSSMSFLTSSDVVTWAGAFEKSFFLEPSEPSLRSARATAAWPPAAARCRGVFPTSSTSSFV